MTYIKELFPKVMEQGEAAVHAMAGGRSKTTDIAKVKVIATVITVLCISAAVVFQDAANGFPAMAPAGTHSSEKVFTPAATLAYYVGFFVDGVVLAYDNGSQRRLDLCRAFPALHSHVPA